MKTTFDSMPAKIDELFALVEELRSELRSELISKKKGSEIREDENTKFLDLPSIINFLADHGFRFSESKIYKLTAKNSKSDFPYNKFGNQLTFDKQATLNWCLKKMISSDKNKTDAFSSIVKSANNKLGIKTTNKSTQRKC